MAAADVTWRVVIVVFIGQSTPFKTRILECTTAFDLSEMSVEQWPEVPKTTSCPKMSSQTEVLGSFDQANLHIGMTQVQL